MWRNISPEDRKPYDEKAAKLKQEYLEKYPKQEKPKKKPKKKTPKKKHQKRHQKRGKQQKQKVMIPKHQTKSH